jgi:hypothetical protein
LAILSELQPRSTPKGRLPRVRYDAVVPGPVTIADDRGQLVPLFQWSSLDAEDRGNAELADAVMRAGEASQQDLARKHLTWRDWPTLAPIAVAAGTMIFMQLLPAVPFWAYMAALVAVMLLSVKLQVREHLRSVSSRYVTALLAYGHCASCGYSLGGIKPQYDHLLQCPECSAQWRSDRVCILKRAPDALAFSPREDPFAIGAHGRAWWGLPSLHRAPSVLDARDRPVALVDRKRLQEALSMSHGPTDSGRILARFRATTRAYAYRLLVQIVGVLLVVFVVVFAPWLPGGFRGAFTNAPWVAAIYLTLAVTSGPYWFAQLCRAFAGRAQATAGRASESLLSDFICPSCARPLPRMTQEADHVTLCSCGAAWRLKLTASIAMLHSKTMRTTP